MAGPEPDPYRLSDDERDQALERLRTAFEEGRLDIDEHEKRSTAAIHAVTNLDLIPLFRDLPSRTHPDSIAENPGTAPATRESAPVEKAASGPGRVEKKDRGPHLGALLGWGGFLFFVWGVPAIVSGNLSSIAVFLGFFLLLMVPGITTAIVRKRRGDGPEELGQGS